MYKGVTGGLWINKDKKQAVQYILYKLREWWKEENNNKKDDIGLLKYLLLLYFITVCERKKGNYSLLLDEIFTELYAQPFGSIEIEVKAYIGHYIDRNKDIILSEVTTIDNKLLKQEIDCQISILKSINKKMISYYSYDLIEVVRSHYSWVLYYRKAEEEKTFSKKIQPEIIKNEERRYFKKNDVW